MRVRVRVGVRVGIRVGVRVGIRVRVRVRVRVRGGLGCLLSDEVGGEQDAGEEAQRREAHVARGRAVVHLAVRECVRYVSASGALA